MSERSFVFIGLLCFIIGILTTLYIWIMGTLSIGDIKLSALNNQINETHNQNLLLEDQLLHLEAYTTIASEAGALGFGPAGYVTLPSGNSN